MENNVRFREAGIQYVFEQSTQQAWIFHSVKGQ
jgi:hypothetical protein